MHQPSDVCECIYPECQALGASRWPGRSLCGWAGSCVCLGVSSACVSPSDWALTLNKVKQQGECYFMQFLANHKVDPKKMTGCDYARKMCLVFWLVYPWCNPFVWSREWDQRFLNNFSNTVTSRLAKTEIFHLNNNIFNSYFLNVYPEHLNESDSVTVGC